MCGLAGYARQEGAPGVDKARQAFSMMMQNIEHRGRHATGIAAGGGDDEFLWKIAQPISHLAHNGRWQEQVERIRDSLFVIGHTRHATMDNYADDRCAHPFRVGRTVVAHNGVIRNWTEIRDKYPADDTREWRVDSEAAAYLIDRHDDPKAAIEQLRGDFALTWVKRGLLHVSRNDGRPLVMAYVRKWRTLFWCSESRPLLNALERCGAKQKAVEVWQPIAHAIYTYDVTTFTNKSANGTRRMLPVPKRDAAQLSFDAWRAQRDNGPIPMRTMNGSGKKKGDPSLAALLADMQARLQELEGIVEGQQAEIAHLMDVCADAGLMDAVYPVPPTRDDEGRALPDQPAW